MSLNHHTLFGQTGRLCPFTYSHDGTYRCSEQNQVFPTLRHSPRRSMPWRGKLPLAKCRPPFQALMGKEAYHLDFIVYKVVVTYYSALQVSQGAVGQFVSLPVEVPIW